jgi:hypothetical protein
MSRDCASIIISSTRLINPATPESRGLGKEWLWRGSTAGAEGIGRGFGGRGRRIGDLGGIKGGRGSCLLLRCLPLIRLEEGFDWVTHTDGTALILSASVPGSSVVDLGE